MARYAFLQQRQNHPEEALEQYTRAAEMFNEAKRGEDALFCWERTAQLDPDNMSQAVESGGSCGAIGQECAGGAVVFARWTIGDGQRRAARMR